jgi:hypothetical protein
MLQGSVLIVALCRGGGALLPVDIRARKPADWRGGALIGWKSVCAEDTPPMDVAHVDSRLFVVDSSGRVRLFDVTTDLTAAGAD